MKTAVAYLRVSTEGQVDGYGLDSQLAAIQEYADQNGIEIIDVYADKGKSGTLDIENRLELTRLFEDLSKAELKIDCVIFHSLGRLARKVMIQEKIISEFRKHGVEPISVKEPDLMKDDEEREMLRGILGYIYQYERAMITNRLRAGRQQKAKKGQIATGRIPYGFRTEIKDGKKVIVKVDEEIAVLKEMFRLRSEGKTFAYIAKYLNEKGFKPRGRKAGEQTKFHGGTIKQMLENPIYQGKIIMESDGQTFEATNEEYRIV